MPKTKPKPILAVGYCRKSTNEERAEKSIADQKARIKKMRPSDDKARYEIVRWYVKDKGVPGWKRGASRPDYFRLVEELKETGAKAIIVDDMDRFSRADEMETVADVQRLRELGVCFIHAVNQGFRDLHQEGTVHIIAAQANASHAHSTRLSRRIANARCDAAKEGKRSGGQAPYAMENDGKGGLLHGDAKQVRVVRQVFRWFVTELKSMNWIAGQLNKRGIPARHGGKWHVATVKELLQRVEYSGTFRYNAKKSGQFHVINGDHEVVAVHRYDGEKRQPWKATDEGAFLKRGVYKPMVTRKVFDGARKRLDEFGMKGCRRPRADGYPLSRILVCDHCGKPMYGCTHRGQRVYRCSTNAKQGAGSCGYYWIKERDILPFVLEMLAKEVEDVKQLLSSPPDELRHPRKAQAEHREQTEAECKALVEKIERAEDNLMASEDDRTRKALDRRLTAMRDELERLEASLTDDQPKKGYRREELEALAAWWDDFERRAVSVPVEGGLSLATWFHRDPQLDPHDQPAVLVDTRAVNEALHELGCEVRLRWKTEEVTLKNGRKQHKYTLSRGRFRLGQRDVTFRKLPLAAGATRLPLEMLAGADRVFDGNLT